MKKALIIMLISLMTITALAGCGSIKTDPDGVKIIPKAASTDVAEPGAPSEQKGSQTAGNTDLQQKSEALQADTEEYIKNVLGDKLTEVLSALRDYDMEKLSEYVHPEKGIRFTAYTHVDVDHDQVFSRDQIKAMGLDTAEYLWGSYDGSGEPIKLTFGDYYKKFIYDVDFMNAETMNISNTKLPNHGNMIDNGFEVYMNAIIAEYYFPGFDPQYEGMDWRSLRLVFEKLDDTWYLVGIIHGQWTI